MDWPSSVTDQRRNESSAAEAFESRLPVGSSANTRSGLLIKARAHATRCCCPPDSSDGRCPEPPFDAEPADQVVEPFLVHLVTGQVGWQRDVLRRRQRRDEVEGLENEPHPVAPELGELGVVEAADVRPPRNDGPEVWRSSPAMQCIRVDFPDPEGPMTAVNQPRSKVTLTRSRARTAACPAPSIFSLHGLGRR